MAEVHRRQLLLTAALKRGGGSNAGQVLIDVNVSRQRLAWVGSIGLLFALVAGCVGGARPADEDLVGRWVDASGRELPDASAASNGILVLKATIGSTTCTTDNVTVFIQLAWPVGREVDWASGDWSDQDAPSFIRDTSGGGIRTFGPSDLDVQLPRTARPTGFQHQGNQLSVGPKPDAIYVTRPDGHTEQWARMRPGEGCA